MDVFSLALAFFLIANPVGNVPAVVGLIKNFPFDRQIKIMLRECLIAFALAILFQGLGEKFMEVIEIETYALSIAGGILLFIVALGQIFPTNNRIENTSENKEPFVVPIATPLITGGGLMSSIMLYSSLVDSPFTLTAALVLAWVGIMPIMMCAPLIQRLLGKVGILALEQLMGLILALLSMQLIVRGAIDFTQKV